MSLSKTHSPLSIGGIEAPNPFWIAPLAGITVPAVRRFFVRYGAGLTHTEMVSCAGIMHNNVKTMRMLRNGGEGSPTVLQFFAGSAGMLRQGAERALVSGHGEFGAFSINMACPMPKVIKKGAGAALLGREKTARDMVQVLKGLQRPVWIKMRLLSTDSVDETLRFIANMIGAGADHVTLHGRTPAQRYEGLADASSVCRAARVFQGKISASGDVFSPDAAMKYLEGGACAVLFARGVIRDPFIVERTVCVREKGSIQDLGRLPPVAKIERLMGLGKDLYLDEGEKTALVLLKRFLSSIFKGLRGASRFRREVAGAQSWKEMTRVLETWRRLAERSDFDVREH